MEFIIGLIILALDIYALLDLWGGRSDGERKILWTVVIILLPLLGMAGYFLVGRDRKLLR